MFGYLPNGPSNGEVSVLRRFMKEVVCVTGRFVHVCDGPPLSESRTSWDDYVIRTTRRM